MSDTLINDTPVERLPEDECWALLAQEEFGRLAFRLVDEVHLVPINYLVDDGTQHNRSAPGAKLLAAELESDVAFEIDWHDDQAAWSVVARGHIRRLDEAEEDRVDALPLRSWLDTHKYDVVQLVPTSVTGRRFVLTR